MIINNDCMGCGMCVEYCERGAIIPAGDYSYKIDALKCLKCGMCLDCDCPGNAIDDC